MDILGKRYYFYALSFLLIVPGLILLAIDGLPLSIDFTGGSLLEVRFEGNFLPEPSEVISVYHDLGIEDVQVQTTGEDTILARSSFIDDESLRADIVDNLGSKFNREVTVLRFDSVGPTVGQEVAARAALAVTVASVIVIIYLTFAFRGVLNAFRYGICAIIAMVHDVALVFSLTGFGAHFFGWQVDALYLTALLTVIGFSVQDNVVVFDRVRENAMIYRNLPFEKLVNHSIVQTLQRSINTQLMTVEFMLLALALFGGITLREFSIILLVGLFSGTYSSIFVAAPILVTWHNREWRTWFHRETSEASV